MSDWTFLNLESSQLSQKHLLAGVTIYSGDLNSKHLNSGSIWITNFHLFAIQMPGNSCYSNHDLNSELKIHYSIHQSCNLSVKQPVAWIANYYFINLDSKKSLVELFNIRSCFYKLSKDEARIVKANFLSSDSNITLVKL